MQGDDTIYTGSGSGPAMEGTWFNPQTGDSFTVRDTFIEGDTFYIIATDGRQFDANMISQYLQCEEGFEPPKFKKPEIDVNQGKLNLSGIDSSIQVETREQPKSDESILDQKLPTAIPAEEQPASRPVNQQESRSIVDEDDLFIKRLLSRGDLPAINFKIDWKKYPAKQMEMLLEYMAVDIDKISDFYINHLDLEEIRKEIQSELSKFILKKQEPDPADEKLDKTEKPKKTQSCPKTNSK